MERFAFGFVAAAFMLLGVAMIIWPDWVISKNRDKDDSRAPTKGEILSTRVLGAVFIAVGAYGLYAILTGIPGAEFFPV